MPENYTTLPEYEFKHSDGVGDFNEIIPVVEYNENDGVRVYIGDGTISVDYPTASGWVIEDTNNVLHIYANSQRIASYSSYQWTNIAYISFCPDDEFNETDDYNDTEEV